MTGGFVPRTQWRRRGHESPRSPCRRPAESVRVKVCGLTEQEKALASCGGGRRLVGLNFHPGSPRLVDPAVAAEIVATLPSNCEAVGLFVDRPPAEIAEIAARVGLKIVQLHGQEPPEDLLALRHLFVVRAYRLGDAQSLARMVQELRRAGELARSPDAVLVDAYVPGQAGGTGQMVAPEIVSQLPLLPRLILAGGLTPENVSERVRRLRPWMVDVASGVESSPGREGSVTCRRVRPGRSWFSPGRIVSSFASPRP